MIRALGILSLCALAGCAGKAAYRIHPYTDSVTGQMVCCEAMVSSSRDVASVVVHATKNLDGSFTLDLTETGVSASAPIQAQNGAVSAVAGAVSNSAAVAAKLIP